MSDFLFDIEAVRRREDPAMGYRYFVQVPVPSSASVKLEGMYVEDIQFQFPYHQQDTLVLNSTVVHYAGRLQVPPITIRFYESYRHIVSQAMEAWMSIIRNGDGTMKYGSEYKRNIYVQILDSQGASVASYNFLDCFPLESSPFQMSYARSERTTFTQTFSVDSVVKLFKEPLPRSQT